MRRPVRLPRLAGHYLNHQREQLAAILAVAAALQIAAAVGLTYVAGFSRWVRPRGTSSGDGSWRW